MGKRNRMGNFYGYYWYFPDTGTGSQPIIFVGSTTNLTTGGN